MWEGSQGDRELGLFHVISRDDTSSLHVGLDIEQVFEANSPRFAWCSFEHEAPKLSMVNRRTILILLRRTSHNVSDTTSLC